MTSQLHPKLFDYGLSACPDCYGAPELHADTGTGLSRIGCTRCDRMTSHANLAEGPSAHMVLVGEWEGWPSPSACPCCGSSARWEVTGTTGHLQCQGCGLRSREASGLADLREVLVSWNGSQTLRAPVARATLYTTTGRPVRVHFDDDPERDRMAREWGWDVEQADLYRGLSQPAIPLDCVVLPLTPTQAMLDAVNIHTRPQGPYWMASDTLSIFRTLVANAPEVRAHPVWDGTGLPPLGARVLIHLARQDEWAEHVVTGYYVWDDLSGNEAVKRVFINVADSRGYPNARLLCDVRPVEIP